MHYHEQDNCSIPNKTSLEILQIRLTPFHTNRNLSTGTPLSFNLCSDIRGS
jgi:hypothetical protein